MKKLLLVFCLLSLPALAQNAPAPAAAPAPAPVDPVPAAKAIMGQMQTMFGNKDASAASWDALDAKIAGYQKQVGVTEDTTKILVLLRKSEIGLAKQIAPDRYQALVKQLIDDPTPEVSGMAQDIQAEERRLASLKSKPLDLQFTAVDGNAIDLAKYRGKVVLIDFWATWCGPCVQEVPHVVETYQKYHDQGFVILGISLDQDKDALTQFTQQHNMPWPQYFDGLGWQNKISSNFGIHSIPAMWLIDKKGMLVSTNGRSDLAGQVAKLLATP